MKSFCYKLFVIFILGILVFSSECLLRADSYYDRKVSLYELLPIGQDDIVFVGNSITDGAELHELLGMPNIKNRGITSDVISGVEKRLGQILNGHPKKVFLLIGGNDLSHKLTAEQIAAKYEKLVKKMRSMSPDTHFYIKSIAEENGCTYIDLTEALQDPATGKLKREYTNDGLHLTGAGYRAWMSVVEPYVKAE